MNSRFHYKERLKRGALIVDDEEVNREILGGILENDYNILYAENGEEALKQLEYNRDFISVILLDLLMPVKDGYEVIDEIQKDSGLKRIPIVVMTSDRTAEVECLKKGAFDFITKPFDMPEIVRARIQRIVELYEDQEIIRGAERDELTGVFNRSFFFEYCEKMEQFFPERKMDAVAINIDHFQLINEIYGRDFGDEVLKSLAKVMKIYANMNEGIAGRGEADQFYMFLNHQSNYEKLDSMLSEESGKEFRYNQLHARVGVYTKEMCGSCIENMFDRAKTASNTVRGNFQKRVAIYDEEMQKKALHRERLVHDMHAGINEKQFIPYFQPKYGIQEGEPYLKSAEALIRWRHPEFGLIPPFEFISLFEENGLIQQVDHYIWKETARQIRKWKDEYHATIPVSVNVSRIDFYDPHLVENLIEIVQTSGIEAKDLHLEVTESAYADNATQLVDVINQLREEGFVIELDDFGTGYSALNMLSSIPIDVLKLDMQFVRNMYENDKNLQMINIIMNIAKMLGVPVVAEGVEEEKQCDDLKKMGCDMIQGYYFSKPVPAEEFASFIK